MAVIAERQDGLGLRGKRAPGKVASVTVILTGVSIVVATEVVEAAAVGIGTIRQGQQDRGQA